MVASTSRTSRWVTSLFTAFGLLCAALACNREPLHDVGYTTGDLSQSDDTSGAPLPPVAEFASEFTGVWLGNAEDPLALQSNADTSPPLFRFPSGSSRIRIELSSPTGDVFPSGTITFGEAPAPPVATDPDVGYPIERDLASAHVFPDPSVRPAVEGFHYRLTSGSLQRDLAASGIDEGEFLSEGFAIDGKFEFSYAPTQAFESWCSLQTEESCPARETLGLDDGGCTIGEDFAPIDCLKASQCLSGVCQCTGNHCSYSVNPLSSVTLRFSDEDGLVGLGDGTFINERGFQQPLGTLHFRREAAGSGQR